MYELGVTFPATPHVLLSFRFCFSVDVFEKALNAGFIQATDYVEICQSYLDYLRRRVDFNKGEKMTLPVYVIHSSSALMLIDQEDMFTL